MCIRDRAAAAAQPGRSAAGGAAARRRRARLEPRRRRARAGDAQPLAFIWRCPAPGWLDSGLCRADPGRDRRGLSAVAPSASVGRRRAAPDGRLRGAYSMCREGIEDQAGHAAERHGGSLRRQGVIGERAACGVQNGLRYRECFDGGTQSSFCCPRQIVSWRCVPRFAGEPCRRFSWAGLASIRPLIGGDHRTRIRSLAAARALAQNQH